jgi:hypothetical protein
MLDSIKAVQQKDAAQIKASTRSKAAHGFDANTPVPVPPSSPVTPTPPTRSISQAPAEDGPRRPILKLNGPKPKANPDSTTNNAQQTEAPPSTTSKPITPALEDPVAPQAQAPPSTIGDRIPHTERPSSTTNPAATPVKGILRRSARNLKRNAEVAFADDAETQQAERPRKMAKVPTKKVAK